MSRRERGVIVEERGSTALVRVEASGACAGCAAAGACQGRAGGDGRMLEALNPLGAREGVVVEVLVDAAPRAWSAARRWGLPALGLVAGAAAAQVLAVATVGAGAGDRAAGLGAIAGAAAGIFLARVLEGRRRPGRPPAIVRVVEK